MARARLRTLRSGLSLAVLLALAAGANAQAPRPPFSNNEMRDAIAGAASPDARAKIDKYFDDFFFARFLKPATSEDLPNLRMQYKNLVRGIAKSDAHDYLVEKVMYPKLRGILGSGAPKAIKVNAMLLLGELNEDDKAIKPAAEPLGLVITVARMNRPDFEYLKPAALVGLVRVADAGAIPKDKAPDVATAMLAIVNQKDAPPGRSASAHHFVRRSAAQVLALLGSPGPNNSVLAALEGIMADPQSSLVTKCEMARYIGMLKFPPGAKVDVQGLANRIGHQAVELCDQEVAKAEKQGNDQHAAKASQRVIMYVLESSDAALQGLYETAERGSESQKFIADLKKEIAALLRQVGEVEESRESEVSAIVDAAIEKVKEILLAKPAASGPLVAAGAGDEPAKPARTN
jgi:hypothetical protein